MSLLCSPRISVILFVFLARPSVRAMQSCATLFYAMLRCAHPMVTHPLLFSTFFPKAQSMARRWLTSSSKSHFESTPCVRSL